MSITLHTLTIPAPWWLTSNGRYHWADRARRTRHIRDAATLTYTGDRAPGNGPWLIVAEVAYPTAAGRGWHFDETDECLDETACYCDRYEPTEGQGNE